MKKRIRYAARYLKLAVRTYVRTYVWFSCKEARYIPRVSRVNVFSGYVVISVMDVLTSKSRVYLWKRRHLEFHEIISKTDLV